MPAAERAGIVRRNSGSQGIARSHYRKGLLGLLDAETAFLDRALSGRLLFKGGTSLSKIFHAINRFSEDIDLAVDYAALGFTGERDPRREDISKTRRAGILAEMMTACRQYIGGEFLDALKTRCQEVLGAAGAWSLDVSGQDPNVVRFRYPAATAREPCLRCPPGGARAGNPCGIRATRPFHIRSFAGEEFPELVADGDVGGRGATRQADLLEKATILHAEYHRPPEKPLPERYSRHYYDVALLAEGAIRAEALADMSLLAQVARHKETFYPSAWARYDLACPGSFRLLPAAARLAALERDYRNMGVMIFGAPPAFGKLMETLAALEKEMNT